MDFHSHAYLGVLSHYMVQHVRTCTCVMQVLYLDLFVVFNMSEHVHVSEHCS